MGLVLTITMVASEALAVITILPTISRELHGVALYGWVVSAFSLGTLFGIVAGGEQTDRRGPAWPFAAGLGLFVAGLVIAGSTPSMPVLVLARGLQGIGAGSVPAVLYASISRAYHEDARPRLFAILSTAWVVPGLLGPSAAAVVATHTSWRWVFLGLVPLVAATGAVAFTALRRLGGSAATERHASRLPDALRVAAGLGLALGGAGTRSPLPAALLVAAGLAVGLGPLRRLMPAGTFRAAGGLPAAVLARGLLNFSFFGADTFVPLLLASVRGQSTTVVGVTVTGATMFWTAGAWLQARQAGSWSSRRLIGTGFGILSLGIALVASALSSRVPVPVGIAGWCVGGLGIGIAYSSISLVVLRHAAPGQEGATVSSMQLLENVGVALATGLGGAAVATATVTGLPVADGVAAAFALALLSGLGGLVLARQIA